MNGAILDSVLTMPRRAAARRRAGHIANARYVHTKAGRVRVVDSGGNKPALLLTPDGPCVIEHYAALIEKFSEHFRVICFDMPGMGFSFSSARHGFGIAQTADAIVALMDQLSVLKTAVAFSCANGLIAINLAARYPQRVSHLVLAQTPSFDSMRQWTERMIPKVLRIPYLGQVVTAARANDLATHWFDLALPRGSEHKKGFVSQTQDAMQAGACFCLASSVQGILHGSDDLTTSVQCPTLAIHGNNDFTHKYTDFRSITEHIPHARLLAYEGSGHFPDLERADDYIEHVLDFLRKEGR